MSSYAVFVIPAAQKVAANRLLAMVFGDDILNSANISAKCSASGSEPPTHWLGGLGVEGAVAATLQALATDLPAPDGGWPLMVGDVEALSETDAQVAASALYLNINTGENAEDLPAQNLATVLSALNLQQVVFHFPGG